MILKQTLTKQFTKAFFAVGLVFGLSQSAEYDLDKSHSHIGFKVSHMVISKTKGEFKDYSTELKWDPKDLKNSVLNATIQAGTINTDDEKRDEHLRAPDFFDTAKYPTISFKSKKITKKGKGYEVLGSLTMKDVTKDVKIPFTVNGPVQDPWGNTRLGFEGSLTVNRKDYNISWSNKMDNGGLVVGDEVTIDISVEGIAKK